MRKGRGQLGKGANWSPGQRRIRVKEGVSATGEHMGDGQDLQAQDKWFVKEVSRGRSNSLITGD
jgi:hypothetical protein